jgi:methionyl aminopeptidase
MDQKEIDKILQAGKIAKEVINYANSIIKKDMPLLKIANLIDQKILSLNAKPAFPINLSINEIAAHSTPSFNDETLAHGLLKIDIGVHIEGFVADTAFSLDLENSAQNQLLIKTAIEARDKALSSIQLNTKLKEIGAIIDQTCQNNNVLPIHNLSGHSIEQYNLHSGLTIPNFDNNSVTPIQPGLYAIEPFTTLQSGSGSVKEGKLSGIYHLENTTSNVRDTIARKVLQFIKENYNTLPFCSRWIHAEFGTRGLLSLKQIEQAGLLHHYPQLIESSGKPVAQAEHTVLLTENDKIITTQ